MPHLPRCKRRWQTSQSGPSLLPEQEAARKTLDEAAARVKAELAEARFQAAEAAEQEAARKKLDEARELELAEACAVHAEFAEMRRGTKAAAQMKAELAEVAAPTEVRMR